MNLRLSLKIPFTNSATILTVVADTCLNPFYVSEKELLSIFLDKYTEEQFSSAREIIFFNSITADDLIRDSLKNLSEKEIALFKRNLTLCLSTIAFGNKFNSDFIKSLSRSKSLAEFSVSTSATNDPQFVVNLIRNATQCVEDAKEALESYAANGEGLIQSFVKGARNAKAVQVDRLWHHYNLLIQSTETYASAKKQFNGRYYKNGGSFR